QMIQHGHPVKGAKVNVLGLTFKEDVPDLRNSRVIDVINEMKSYGVAVHVHDPVATPADAHEEYGVELLSWDKLPRAEALIVAVPHKDFLRMNAAAMAAKLVPQGCFIDVKSRFDRKAIAGSGINLWRL
ncbi:MAG TPA: UDP binding domain-containing protein, partial [Burkholderiales bacterium]|nr:UDP binding domain-containing protein [Burkholderiales bacterium]